MSDDARRGTSSSASLDPFAHLDETGARCSRHPLPSVDALMALALIGSRAPGFHHDLASKLQGLMMSLDEISEIAEAGDPALATSTTTAQEVLREMLALLTINRALTRPPVRARTTLAEVLDQAANRVHVQLRRTDAVNAPIDVAVPTVVHALALLLEVVAGPGRTRHLSPTFTSEAGHVTASIAVTADATIVGEMLALATYALAANRGTLRCVADGSRFEVRFPIGT